MNRLVRAVSSVLISAGFASAACSQMVLLWNQPPDLQPKDFDFLLAHSSREQYASNPTRPNGDRSISQQAADTIRFEQDQSITMIEWWGGEGVQANPAYSFEDIESFIIRISGDLVDGDGPSEPGEVIFTVTVPASEVLRTSLGQYGTFHGDYEQAALYQWTPGSPMTVPGGRVIWLQITASYPNGPEGANWSWSKTLFSQQSSDSDRYHAWRVIRPNNTYEPWNRQSFGVDMAFRLYGPEPCIADWNEDSAVDGEDVSDFLSDIESMNEQADLNVDGETEMFDVFAFLELADLGCTTQQ